MQRHIGRQAAAPSRPTGPPAFKGPQTNSAGPQTSNTAASGSASAASSTKATAHQRAAIGLTRELPG